MQTSQKYFENDTILNQKKKLEIIKKMVSKKDEFKERGKQVVRKEDSYLWESLVDKIYEDIDQLWYMGICLEAATSCMEMLSQESSIDKAYELISVDSNQHSKLFFGMSLTRIQSKTVAFMVSSYHERGKEFADYRDYVLDRGIVDTVIQYKKI